MAKKTEARANHAVKMRAHIFYSINQVVKCKFYYFLSPRSLFRFIEWGGEILFTSNEHVFVVVVISRYTKAKQDVNKT